MNNLSRVMVVDDQPAYLMMLETILQANGYEVFLYKDPAVALQMASVLNPDVILIDKYMPMMDGLTLCKAFKNEKSLAETPVIFISSETEEQKIAEMFACGGVDFVRKPFLEAEVLARVTTHIGIKRQRERMQLLIARSFHELYAPLGVIETSLSLLEASGHGSPYLTKISLASQSLSSIYKDLYYALKREVRHDESRMIDLGFFMESSIVMFEVSAKNKGMTLKLEKSQDGQRVYLPESALERIVNNTLSNAIKYGEKDSPIVVSCERQDDQTLLRIANRGEIQGGFAQIFERYYQSDRRSEGLGLGLDLVRSICDDYGIRVNVTSGEGMTTFSYLFPRGENL